MSGTIVAQDFFAQDLFALDMASYSFGSDGEIRKGMPGLKQAGKIANDRLTKHLAFANFAAAGDLGAD